MVAAQIADDAEESDGGKDGKKKKNVKKAKEALQNEMAQLFQADYDLELYIDSEGVSNDEGKKSDAFKEARKFMEEFDFLEIGRILEDKFGSDEVKNNLWKLSDDEIRTVLGY